MKRFFAALLLLVAIILLANLTQAESTTCIQVITYAKNPDTGEWQTFPTPCDVPEGWETTYENPDTVGVDENDQEKPAGANDDGTLCAQVVTRAQNPVTGNWFEFPTPCDVPDGWKTAELNQSDFMPYCTASGSMESGDDGWLNGYMEALAGNEAAITENGGIEIKSLRINDNAYHFTLIPVLNPDDPEGMYFKLSPESIRIEQPNFELTADDNGNSEEMTAGDVFVIKLESNPTTGYIWSLKSLDHSVVLPNGNRYISSCDGNMVGCGGVEYWQFKTVGKGETVISMEYHRPFETGVEPAQTFQVTVVVSE